MTNLHLNTKHIFLSFLQALFDNAHPLTWNSDPKLSKIIIADKYSIERPIIGTRPVITYSRGSMSYQMISRGQDAVNATNLIRTSGMDPLAGNLNLIDSSLSAQKTDIVRSGATISIYDKNGLQAEEIADFIVTNIIAHRSQFRAAGIRALNNITIGPEEIVRVTSEIEVTAIRISLVFELQHTIIKQPIFYNARIFDGRVEKYENFDYTIVSNGTQISFEVAPVNNPLISYIEAITYSSYDKVELTATADPTIWNVPSVNGILGRYQILRDIFLTTNTDD